MSKEYLDKFTRQLQAFVENTSPAKPSAWIGTILDYTPNLMHCDVQTNKGVLRDIPTFGIPNIGTTAIILFIEDSYDMPVAICNPINVLDEDKIKTVITQDAHNYHSNGDFTKEDTGYTGDFLIDDSVDTGIVDVSIEYEGCLLHVNETPNPKRFDNYILKLENLEQKSYGAIPIQATIKTTSNKPVDKAKIKFYIYGEPCFAHTNEDGIAVYNCYPRHGFTDDGYFAVLPQKDSGISFDCVLKDGEKDYFKVQMYYQSKGSVLGITVKDKETNQIIQAVPSSLSGDKATWNIKNDKWMVNRETYPRDNHKTINVTITNEGDNPIRIDGILVHDESAKYAYYKSKEDILNGE